MSVHRPSLAWTNRVSKFLRKLNRRQAKPIQQHLGIKLD